MYTEAKTYQDYMVVCRCNWRHKYKRTVMPEILGINPVKMDGNLRETESGSYLASTIL